MPHASSDDTALAQGSTNLDPQARPGLSLPKRFLFVVLTLTTMLFCAELALQILCLLSTQVHSLLSWNSFPRIHDPILGHRGDPRHPDHDERGFRNSNAPSHAAIVAMGDSQTYGTGVRPNQAWPKQLNKRLHGIGVYSMAFGGYCPAHSVLLIDEALQLEPKLVIATVYAGNDLRDAVRFVYTKPQLAELRSDDTELALELATPRARTRPAVSWTERTSRLFFENCRLWGVGRAVKAILREYHMLNEAASTFMGYPTVPFEDGEIATTLTPAYRLQCLDLSDSMNREGLRLVEVCLRNIDRRLRGAGVNFVVVLIPTKELVFEQRVGSNINIGADALARLLGNEKRMWTELADFLSNEGIPAIDVLPALRRVLSEGTQPYPASPDGHPNVYGHAVIAMHIHDVLEAKGVLEGLGSE